MQVAPLPPNEGSRLAALHLLHLLDTLPEERFDRLTRVARRMFSVPIALVSLVDADRQWFKSHAGVEITETSRDVSICAHTILGNEALVISDVSQDDRFFDSPLVTGPPHIRFYAGFPLRVGSEAIGALCLIDSTPRTFSLEEQATFGDIAAIAQQEIASQQMATTDALTSIPNRRGFEVLAGHTLHICKRMAKPATLLFFDLNHFKAINDTFGHGEGDRALKDFAHVLGHSLRASDVIGRLGGDEFVVLLTGAHAEHSASVVDRLREAIVKKSAVSGKAYKLDFSVGHVQIDPRGDASIDDLLASADAEMYEDKNASRSDTNPR